MTNFLYTKSTTELSDSGRLWSAGGIVDTNAPIIAVVPTADIEDEDGNELKAGETYLMTPSVLPYTLSADVQTDIPNMSVVAGGGGETMADSKIFSGIVDADAELADFPAGKSLHFHTTGLTNLTTASANLFGVIVNGNATGGNPTPYILAAGIQGYISKNDAGDVNITYTEAENASFGDAQVKVSLTVAEAARQHITVTNTNGNQYGISNYLFHLSDDPAVVGTLAGTTITLQNGVPKDLYLVGPSTEGTPADGDFQHNGTVTGVHFQALFDGNSITYTVVDAVRHHPGPGDYATRSYDSVDAAQTVALTLASTNFGLLFSGFSVSAPSGGISGDVDNRLTLGSDGLPYLGDTEVVYKNVVAEVSNGAGNNTLNTETTYTPAVDGDYTVLYSGAVVSGTGGISVGTATGLSDLFVSEPATGDADGSRLTTTRQDNFTPAITLTGGVTYFITQWAGGGGLVNDHTVCVIGQIVSVAGTVTTAATAFTTTDGVQVKAGGFYREFPDGTTSATPTVAEYNEFINNYKPLYIALSYEAAGGGTAVIKVNGVDATYKDLTNATDAGGGQVNFSSGANGNFNRQARVDAEVLKEVGDTVEISGVNVASFSGMHIAILDNETDLAHTTTGLYKFITTAGSNQNVEGYSFRDSENTILASGSETNAVYRFTKTLGGISAARDGVEFYCTEVTEFTKYPSQASVTDPTGIYRVGEKHSELTSIANTDDTIVVTGHDLTQATGMELRITFQDDAANHKWATQLHDVDELVARAAANATADGSSTLYDTGYVQIHIEDAATGALRFVDTNREISYVSSELWVAATNRNNSVVTAVQNSGTVSSSYTLTFPAVAEEDPDGWQQANNQDFMVPAELDGRYLINASVSTSNVNASADLTARILVSPANGDPDIVISRDTDPNETPGARGVSLSGVASLVAGDTVRVTGFATGTQTLTDARLTITELNPNVNVIGSATTTPVDSIPLFTGGSAAKTDYLTLPDGRPYTVITDDGTITEVSERAYDGEKYRFVEIEVVKDPSAVGGVYLRANTPGSGRQSQLRLSVVAPATFVANSGANTALPTVIRELETEETIRYLVEFTEPATFGHNELEIAPTGANLDLTIDTASPPLQGSVGVVGVTLYGASPA